MCVCVAGRVEGAGGYMCVCVCVCVTGRVEGTKRKETKERNKRKRLSV